MGSAYLQLDTPKSAVHETNDPFDTPASWYVARPPMPPRRGLVTDLGQCLRAARKALRIDQHELATRSFVSTRQISRWENGVHPPASNIPRLVEALSSAPAPIVQQLARALGISPSASPGGSMALRASFDSIILSAAERRDVLPRHLREFAVEIFVSADRLGLSARDAALLVAPVGSTKEPT